MKIPGKLKSITRPIGFTKNGGTTYPSNLEFQYDPLGNRICKIEKPCDSSGEKSLVDWIFTYYVRDAQGNEMATYEETNANSTANFFMKEHPMYGSSRIDIDKNEIDLITVATPPVMGSRLLGNKFYELNNHLGNVLVTVTDKKIPVQAGTSGIVDCYLADVASASDYYPFGIMIPERSFNGGSYKFGFNGQEKDDEVNGAGNLNTAMFWEYDTRLGRRWNLDPKPLPSYSLYSAFGNNPLVYSDLLGDTTRYFNIRTNKELGTINNSGGMSNVKVDEIAFNKATEKACNNNIDLTNQKNSNEFVSSFNNQMKEMDCNNGTNLIAFETGTLKLNFNGKLLSINSEFDDNSDLTITHYAAHSGYKSGAHRIPNGNYKVDNLISRSNNTMKRDGVGFSLDINHRGKVWDSVLKRNRTLLEIHPDGEENGNWELNNGTDGCIGLQCDRNRLNDFKSRMKNYLNNHSNIRLNVNF